jgi:hypothetical protein
MDSPSPRAAKVLRRRLCSSAQPSIDVTGKPPRQHDTDAENCGLEELTGSIGLGCTRGLSGVNAAVPRVSNDVVTVAS